ncbi:MAG: radical SAM protein [Fibrobacteres bacterium]|nr:radical SAM protein [Fibrobacterota bacterium]
MASPNLPSDISVITTYRCQMRCKMCSIWQNPTDARQEIQPRELEALPRFKFANITGGEPFLRQDIEEIVDVMYRKSDRVVISTSGWHKDRILDLAKRFPRIGIRVSIEGLSQCNDDLRGRPGGFDRGLSLLLELKRMGVKDIGFGQTVSNKNSHDLLPLYELSKNLGMEFATASFHNSYYFHKADNAIINRDEVVENFRRLIDRLLSENRPKSWFRAFFNLGLVNYIQEGRRMLPCEAGSVNFFLDPYGEVYPCNGMEERYWKKSMGNIRSGKSFEEIWNSSEASEVRSCVKNCPKNCWMVGTAAPVMKKYFRHPAAWVVKAKFRSLLGKPVDISQIPYFEVGQDPTQGDLREPKPKDPQ